MKGYCDVCGEVIDETEIFKFGKQIVCNGCYVKLKARNIQTKEFKKFMMGCFVDPCKKCGFTLFECRHCNDHEFYRHKDDKIKMKANFKEIRESVFHSYWLNKTNVPYTVKDDFLDSLIDKDNRALRG
jgi:hypothetical protein